MKPVLIDTSLWIQHFKGETSLVADTLLNREVIVHEFVLGELGLGAFKSDVRKRVFNFISALPRLKTSHHDAVMEFSLRKDLAGKGVGWIDVHLLHACFTQGCELRTLDKRLLAIAHRLQN